MAPTPDQEAINAFLGREVGPQEMMSAVVVEALAELARRIMALEEAR